MIDTLTIDLGDAAKLSMTFSVDGTNTDPTTVSLEVKAPDATVTTYTYAGSQITKTATGVYTKTLTPTAVGTYNYSWIGTGAAAGAEQGAITVKARRSAA